MSEKVAELERELVILTARVAALERGKNWDPAADGCPRCGGPMPGMRDGIHGRVHACVSCGLHVEVQVEDSCPKCGGAMLCGLRQGPDGEEAGSKCMRCSYETEWVPMKLGEAAG